MDLLSFKARYPEFTDDSKILRALDDAVILVSGYSIDAPQRDIATAYMAAHLLSVPQGATEQVVTKVKSGESEVTFSDKTANNDWLNLSTFGKMFLMLIKPTETKQTYGVIADNSPYAINFDGKIDEHGDIVGRLYDPRYPR